MEAETATYQWIDGSGIGPRCLGHVVKEGRVIGFLTDFIGGEETATPADLAACQCTLAKLHALGVKHGDVNKHNFPSKDGEAVLIGFEKARRSEA